MLFITWSILRWTKSYWNKVGGHFVNIESIDFKLLGFLISKLHRGVLLFALTNSPH